MLYLAYDTETTGLPLVQGLTDHTDTNNWPNVYQVAAILFDDFGFEIARLESLVKPDGWVIPVIDDYMKELGAESFHEKMGVSTEMLLEKGRPVKEVLAEFSELASQADEYVCHNVSFDFPVLSCEFHRAGAGYPEGWFDKKSNCTKLLSNPILKIPSFRAGMYKWPTLQEAHKYFFGEEFDGAHDALADVQATVNVFLALKQQIL